VALWNAEVSRIAADGRRSLPLMAFGPAINFGNGREPHLSGAYRKLRSANRSVRVVRKPARGTAGVSQKPFQAAIGKKHHLDLTRSAADDPSSHLLRPRCSGASHKQVCPAGNDLR